MKKMEIMEAINCAMLLGKTVSLKDMTANINDPLVQMANGATDMMALSMVHKLQELTGFSKEEFAEQLTDYKSVGEYFELDEKLQEAQKKASAE